MIEIRQLGIDDAAAYREIRLRALTDHPEAFGVSYREEAAYPLDHFEYMLEPSEAHFSFGAFEDGKLVGICRLLRNNTDKSRHRALVTNVYVVPEVRGQGAARRLMEATIEAAYALKELDHLVLAVTVGNAVARELYIRLGFQPWGIQPRFHKVDDQFYDIEWMVKPLKRDSL